MRADGPGRWHGLLAPAPWAGDVALAAAALVTGLLSTAAASPNGVTYEPRDAWAFALIVLATVPMVLRSRAPLLVLAVTCAAVTAYSLAGYLEGVLPFWLLVTAVTVGARYPVRVVLAAAAYVTALLAVLYLFQHDRGFTLSTLGVQLATFTTAFSVGLSMRSRWQREQALEERAAALEATRAEEAKLAVADERLRIAQELHDVLAHTLSVIAVQAGTGAHVMDTAPQEARRALENVAATSRESLAELRQLLGVLRDGGDGAQYVPTPRLSDVDRLADDVRAAGLPVELVVEGDPDGVPPGVELAVYRVVQESLTNVLKHAGDARACVRLTYRPGAVEAEVTDDGRGLASGARDGGHGLIGMRERVSVYGGTLSTGPGPRGGWRVHACVPHGGATS